MKNLLIKQVIP